MRRSTPEGTGGGGRIPLVDGARIAVIGGGPAGSFFAISLLREAERRGVRPEVVIYERRRAMADPTCFTPHDGPTSCNYCAGGLSPPLHDGLSDLGLRLPGAVIRNRIDSITIQSRWKNIELRVPAGRKLSCVYRGSRPRSRENRDINFDSFLLESARRAGGEVRPALVRSLTRSGSGRPVVRYLDLDDDTRGEVSEEADFVAFAGGVNLVPGRDLAVDPLVGNLIDLLPGFRPPETRKTLIFEVELPPAAAASMRGELFYILYGSRNLRLEMGSIMPKGRFATVVLIGPDIDRLENQSGNEAVIRTFLELPHIRRILPCPVTTSNVGCKCSPAMVVGPARRPYGDRIAAIGDMVTCRLYKDGLHSAYGSARALVDALLTAGLDARSLHRAYWPAIRALNADHWYGRMVFASTALAIRRPALSRVTYQAVLTERKTSLASRRRLESILWRVASGDDTYRSIFRAMLRPATLIPILTGGALVTLRNVLTELALGLRWRGFGRYPTGVYKEDLEAKIDQLDRKLGLGLRRLPVRRMYTIRIRASADRVFRELGRLGDPDRGFFRPRLLDVRRISGGPNEVGSAIRYDVRPRLLSFSIALEQRSENRHLVHRVQDGFARGGVLVFDIEELGASECSLSILVAFRVGGTGGLLGSALGLALRLFLPVYIHDVMWNHALCELKHVVESPRPAPAPDQTAKAAV